MKKYFLCLFLLILVSNIIAAPMVEVSVDIIEIKRALTNNQGVSWNDALKFEEGLNSSSYFNFQTAASGRTAATGVAPGLFQIGSISRIDPLISTLRLMLSDNVARILANPKLATESGSQASFLVGGEIPVPVTSPQGVSIEWKTYGINLQIKPEVSLKDKKVSAMIQVSISDLDYANSIKLNGYDVPALLNRSASSKITVDDGGTVVIAGLKQIRKETTKQSVPLISNIPLVGWFFRSTSDKDSDASMVVFVTFKTIDGQTN